MASYDPYDAEGGFRLAAPLLERVLGELGDVLVEAHVCRAFHAACAGRARGSPAEVVRSVERLAWARARGCSYSSEALATAAAQSGRVDVLLRIERELPNEHTTWRTIGALAAIAQQWQVVRLAYARYPDQHEYVLAAATSAGHALGASDQITRMADLMPPRFAVATEARQYQWFAGLSAHERLHARGPRAFFLMIPGSVDVVTNIRPLGDYRIALSIKLKSVLSDLLVPARYLGRAGMWVVLLGDAPPDWGVSYDCLFLPNRVPDTLLVDGDAYFRPGHRYGTMSGSFDILVQIDKAFREWMRRAGMLEK